MDASTIARPFHPPEGAEVAAKALTAGTASIGRRCHDDPSPCHAGASARPVSVVLPELAVAAGLAGHRVTVCFDGFAAPVFCELLKRFVEHVDTACVHHVATQADVRKLAKLEAPLHLIIVHQPRLLNTTTQAIEKATPANDAISRPAVFCRFAPQAPIPFNRST